MAIRTAEKSLMTMQQNHLERVILKVKNNIRAAAADAIKRLQTTHDRTTAREAIKETIHSANRERQERNQALEKRRLPKTQPPKRKP